MIDFSMGAANQMPLNPRWGQSENVVLAELKSVFEKKFGFNNYILIGSSGSSRTEDESIKLIALKNSALLHSARRVNHYLQAQPHDAWALVLPEFHVAGIGVYARAELSGAKVHVIGWDIKTIESELIQNSISFMSVVPAQLYDLVNAGIQAPQKMKKIIVGGGALQASLKQQALQLGWPVIETYGMTETSSMIAVRDTHENFVLLEGVQVKTDQNGFLQIKCDSLLTAAIQKRASQIILSEYDESAWLVTQDYSELLPDRQIKLLGRSSEYIKILGEGVSLAELHSRLLRIAGDLKVNSMSQLELLPVEHDRRGYELLLVIEEQFDTLLAERLLNQFNNEVRPYEKLTKVVTVHQIPRTELGKLKLADLKSIIKL